MRRRSGPTNPRVQGELALIERIRRRARSSSQGLSLGIGDDCALLRPRPGEEIAVTTDLSIEGRHFRRDLHPPESVGHRAVARGLSDLAAMGARPLAAFLSLGLPPELTRPGRLETLAWSDRFLDGLLGLAGRYKTPLAGGDLAQSVIALADIVLIGAVPRGKALLRSGARHGHHIYVTGSLGGAAFGLRLLSTGSRRLTAEVSAHLWPQPRIQQGLWLRRRGAASAAIDISDGLFTDLRHLCDESAVSAEIDEASLPVFPGAALEDALHGGEDYELLFTAPPNVRVPHKIADVPITQIGRITKNRKAAPRLVLIDCSGGRQTVEPRGWEHFRA